MFWRVPPAQPPAAVPPAGEPSAPPVAEPPAATRPRPLVAVTLGSGVTLLIEGAAADAALDSLDTTALHAAAGPLLDYLAAAGLLPGPPTRQGATQ
jgi:hypothetical protein